MLRAIFSFHLFTPKEAMRHLLGHVLVFETLHAVSYTHLTLPTSDLV